MNVLKKTVKGLRALAVTVGLVKDEELGFLILSTLAKRLVPRYKLTWPGLDWFSSPSILVVLERFGESFGFNAHRRLALQQLLRLVEGVPGDTAECGVFRGLGSCLILEANRKSAVRRSHHIFDSFEGLSAPSELDGTHWQKSDLSVDLESVKTNLSDYSDVVFHKGWIPAGFIEVSGVRFAFVHIDVDLYEPTLESIKFFYERLNDGGVLICDDYGFDSCPGATKAIDDYLTGKVEKMIYLSGGGGFLIKGVLTAV
jgi:O-methyltransferase